MSKTMVRVEGLREIKAALHELPKATAKNVMRRVLKARGEPIADKARDLVPVRFGDLRDSITVSTKLTKRQRGKHKKTGSKDVVEMFVGPGAHPQAHMQEFGTFKEPAQPFMRPAWDSTKNSVLEGIQQDMWKEIKKAVERRARKLAKQAAGG